MLRTALSAAPALRPSLLPLLLLLLTTGGVARGDEVIFRNGDRVSGTVTRAGGKITITNSLFGTVTADERAVASVTATPAPLTTGSATATAPATAPAPTPATAASPTTRPTTVAAATAPATASATPPVAAKPPAKPPAAAAAPKAPPSPPPPPKRWSGSITGTFLATRGNSETETFRAGFDAARKGEGNTLTLNAGYAFGRTENRTTGDASTTTDNWFAQAKFDHSLGKRWYDYAMLRVEADYVAALDIRITPGIGAGYRWIDKPTEHFNTEGGLTWVYENYRNNGEDDHFAVRLAYHYDRKLNENVSLVHNLEYLPNIVDPEDFNLSADVGLRAMVTKTMFAELKAEWKHDSDPAPNAELNDFRYIFGVGWKF